MELIDREVQAEVSHSPNGWQVKRLGELGNFSKGQGIRRSDLTESGIPCVRYGELYTLHENVIGSFGSFIPPDVALSAQRLSRGDILFAGSGETKEEIGVCAAFVHDVEAYAGGDIVILSPKGQDSTFLGYLLNAPHVAAQKASLGQGDAVVHISARNLAQLEVALPPLPEQRAIAAALSDVDALIAALDALVAKKRAVKTAAMQGLLTGKQRLPGFSGAWETKRLGDIGSFTKGRGIRRSDLVENGIACVRYGELYTLHENVVRSFGSFIPSDVALSAQRLSPGDILFAGSGETKEEIGICAAFVDEVEAYAGGDIVILSPEGQDSTFLGYLLNEPQVRAQKASFGQGDAVVHISARNLAQVEVALPSIAEQRGIAAVLSDMDAEIEALEARRDKTRRIKQGMMQELLTGRTRLV